MTLSAPTPIRRVLLACGPAASIVYIATDLAASARYGGYSLIDQAVSELFAIGAPTAGMVSTLFSVSSALLAAFAGGVFLAANSSRALHLAALMLAASALDCLALWNLFPMHMRGEAKSFTDTMHIALSVNPFVWLAPAFVAWGTRYGMRRVSIVALVLLLIPTVFAFRYVPALASGAPTPGLGLSERAAQYGYQIWQAVLALHLMRRSRGDPHPHRAWLSLDTVAANSRTKARRPS